VLIIASAMAAVFAPLAALRTSSADELPTLADLPTRIDAAGIKLVRLPGGDFTMGEESADKVAANHPSSVQIGQGFDDDRPALPARITKPFWIGATEVTVGQFRRFVEATGYKTNAEKSGRGAMTLRREVKNEVDRFAAESTANWKNPGFPQTDEHPVTCVSWRDAMAFCDWLGKSEQAVYRLPTEGEWEYACRGGTKTIYCSGDHPDTLYAYANVADGNLEREVPGVVTRQRIDRLDPAEGDGYAFTAPVAYFKPNPFGLYDMHGNVWEWSADKYQDRIYQARQKEFEPLRRAGKPFLLIDPQGPATTPQHQYGDWRSLRGGSWFVSPISCRSAVRSFAESADATSYIGFRVVRN
jgi:formylglycine-generating enzyme required for sulfatase activity